MISLKNTNFKLATAGALAVTVATGLLAPATASASSYTTPASGAGATFSLSIDPVAMNTYVGGTGMYTTKFWNTADSNFLTKPDGFFITDNDTIADTSPAFNFDVTAKGANPTGQATNRFVKSTSTSFVINDDLTGAGRLGMTGVLGYNLPNYYGPGLGSGLFYGDFSLLYNQSGRQTVYEDDYSLTAVPSGWHLVNNLSGITLPAYDLEDLVLTVVDANNWKFEGNLLMSPENGAFLLGSALQDVGNFCLGVGSYGGCTNPVVTSAVPVPGAVWLFGGALSALIGVVRRKSALPA